jgi:hypothetical protein
VHRRHLSGGGAHKKMVKLHWTLIGVVVSNSLIQVYIDP